MTTERKLRGEELFGGKDIEVVDPRVDDDGGVVLLESCEQHRTMTTEAKGLRPVREGPGQELLH